MTSDNATERITDMYLRGWIFLVGFFISVGLSSPTLAANTCLGMGGTSCNDTGTNQGCYNSCTATWRYWCTGGTHDGKLFTTNTCAPGGGLTVCICGDAVASGPCSGCGFQSRYQEGFCYSDTGCSSACAGVPELPGLAFISNAGLYWMVIAGAIAQAFKRLRMV